MDELRAGWMMVKFGQVVRLNRDRSKDPQSDGLERYVGLEHIEPGDLRVRSWGDVAEGTTFTSRFRPGHVLFGKRRAYQRKVAVPDFEGVCSGDIYVLETADSARLLPELLPFVCQTDAFFEHAVGTSAGSLSPRTNWKSLADFRLTLPPVAVQERLVRVLSNARESDEAASHLADAANAMCESFREHAMQRYWRACPRVALPTLCDDLTVGIVVTPAKYYVDNGGVPALRSLNVWPDRFVLDDLKQLSHAGHEQHLKSELHAGDIAIVRTGDPGRPGNAAVVPEDMDGWNCVDLVLARPSSQIRSEYLACFLNWTRTARRMQGLAPGTKQKHLSVKKLGHLEVALPTLEEQGRFIDEWEGLRQAALAARRRAMLTSDLRLRMTSELLGAP